MVVWFCAPPHPAQSWLTCHVLVLFCRVLSLPRHDSKVAVRVVTDFTEYPYNYLPLTIQSAAEFIGLTKDGRREDSDRWDSLVS